MITHPLSPRSVGTLKSVGLALLLIATMLPMTVSPTHAMPGSAPQAAAAWCWCTQYVANRFGLPSNYPDAKDWGPI